jgi:hypothetical protein
MVLNICLTKVIIMKGLAVTQVILLILGIIVLAIIGYLLYSNYISSVGIVSVEQCKTDLIRVCNTCKSANTIIGQWDPSAFTTYDSRGTDGKPHPCGGISLSKACISSLARNGIISVSSSTFEGCQTPYCDTSSDTPTGKFAQSICVSVGVN